jgi:hypothetical protein
VRDQHNQYHVVTREGSKTFYYAVLYGAQEKKCGENILAICTAALKLGVAWPWEKFFGDSKDPAGDKLLWPVGEVARRNFLDGIPGLGTLLEILEGQVVAHKAIKGLDGRIVPIRSPHSALNFLVQSAGAIICKRWLVEAFDECVARGWKHGWDGDFVFVLWVHDEIQVACRKGLENEIGEILVKQAKAAGIHYKLRVPLDSKYSVGQSWADTH